MATCVKCQEEVAERAERCPSCGALDPTNALGDSLFPVPPVETALAVELRGISIPFMALVVLMVKLSLAAIPAVFILSLFWAFVFTLGQ